MAIGNAGTMKDITISGYTRPYKEQRIYCTLLDTYGREIKKMYWYDNDATSGKVTTPARYGWYDITGKTVYNDDPLMPGQGLWFTVDKDYSINNSGEVIQGTYAVAITNGSQYVSNPMPVTIQMGELHVSGYTRPYKEQRIYCTLLDTYGREIKKMYWYDNDATSGKVTTPARYGWYDITGKTCYNETDSVKAGEALWFTVDKDYILTWPSAIPAKEEE